MVKWLCRCVSVALMTFLIGGVSLASPFDDAVTAYTRGDYPSALRLWEKLAAQGC